MKYLNVNSFNPFEMEFRSTKKQINKTLCTLKSVWYFAHFLNTKSLFFTILCMYVWLNIKSPLEQLIFFNICWWFQTIEPHILVICMWKLLNVILCGKNFVTCILKQLNFDRLHLSWWSQWTDPHVFNEFWCVQQQ